MLVLHPKKSTTSGTSWAISMGNVLGTSVEQVSEEKADVERVPTKKAPSQRGASAQERAARHLSQGIAWPTSIREKSQAPTRDRTLLTLAYGNRSELEEKGLASA